MPASSRWCSAATARWCSARPWPCAGSARTGAAASDWSMLTPTPTSGTPATRRSSVPTPGGIAYPELEQLLRGLTGSPECLGIEVTVFDPDFDVEGVYAQDLVNALVAGLSGVGSLPHGMPVSEPEPEPALAPVIPAQTKRSARSRRTSSASS